jgi:hypothetical protein
MLSGDSEVMDDLIKTDPYIQTLLKRSDAIEKLLHILKANKGFTPIGSPTILLYRAEFKNRMTDAERAQMDEIISNFSDVPIYGTTTP